MICVYKSAVVKEVHRRFIMDFNSLLLDGESGDLGCCHCEDKMFSIDGAVDVLGFRSVDELYSFGMQSSDNPKEPNQVGASGVS